MTSIRVQFDTFIIALTFLTRLPIPIKNYSDSKLHSSVVYYPLVGLVIGGLIALIYSIALFVFSDPIAIILSMIFGFYLTGGFHEDGLADVCDGFGGGITVERKLEIMKDSRLGTYGTLGLVSVLLLKYTTLTQLSDVICALIVAHATSRAFAASIIFSSNYVQLDSLSKVKPVAKQMSAFTLSIILLQTGIGLILLGMYYSSLFIPIILLFCLIVIRQLLIRWFHYHLTGYTGDCLGFAQQIFEITIYLFFVSLIKVSL